MMDKVILVIDKPNNCSECPCYNDGECGNQYKGYVGDYLGWNSGRPSWCKLKPLPQKKGITESMVLNQHYQDLVNYHGGWNACLDEIIGDMED